MFTHDGSDSSNPPFIVSANFDTFYIRNEIKRKDPKFVCKSINSLVLPILVGFLPSQLITGFNTETDKLSTIYMDLEATKTNINKLPINNPKEICETLIIEIKAEPEEAFHLKNLKAYPSKIKGLWDEKAAPTPLSVVNGCNTSRFSSFSTSKPTFKTEMNNYITVCNYGDVVEGQSRIVGMSNYHFSNPNDYWVLPISVMARYLNKLIGYDVKKFERLDKADTVVLMTCNRLDESLIKYQKHLLSSGQMCVWLMVLNNTKFVSKDYKQY
jgi:hypothetical protein